MDRAALSGNVYPVTQQSQNTEWYQLRLKTVIVHSLIKDNRGWTLV